MNHVQIPVEANNADWLQRCNVRMENLKSTTSQTQLLPHELSRDVKIMNFKLYEAVDKDGDVDRFVDALEQVCFSEGLPLSTIFDQVTPAGDSLLHVAIYSGREQIAELISHHFPSLLIRRNILGETALHTASWSNSSNIVKVILSCYIEEKSKHGLTDEEDITKARDEYGSTALHVAVKSKDVGVIKELLLADKHVVHYLEKKGYSPLYYSVFVKDEEILGLLLEIPFPADEPLPQCRGNSPLHAAILNRDPVVLGVILKARPELIYFRDEDGGTPLHYAAYTGYVEGVQILLKESIQTALERNKKGNLPIHIACKIGHVKVVKEILQHELPDSIILLNLKGQNILHVAAKAGVNSMVKYLLSNKKIDSAVINGQDVNGNTPLHLAARYLFTENLYSLSRDKRIAVKLNNEGLTAMDIVLLHERENSYRLRKELSINILRSADVRVPMVTRYSV